MWIKLKKLKNFTYDFVPTLLFEDEKSTAVFKLRNAIKVLFVIIKLIFFNLFKWTIFFLLYLKLMLLDSKNLNFFLTLLYLQKLIFDL